MKRFHITTLRTFLTAVTLSLVALSLLCTGVLFYQRTAGLLTNSYQETIDRQLNQINQNAADKIQLIDSLYPLMMSNSSIRDNLDPYSSAYDRSSYEKRLTIEKQLSYLLISNYLWNEKYMNAVTIVDSQQNLYEVTVYKQRNRDMSHIKSLLQSFPASATRLNIHTLTQDNQSIYFMRHIYSMYTGECIGTVIIDINQKAFQNSYLNSVNDSWMVYLFNQDIQLFSNPILQNYQKELSALGKKSGDPNSLTELSLGSSRYAAAAKYMGQTGLTSVVAAPKTELFAGLHQTLQSFLLLFTIILAVALLLALIISRLITRPVKTMITQVKRISKGDQEQRLTKGMYDEFNEFADAFNHMLTQLDIYYTDIYQKQLLLKNARIKSLQSQMDPHFLFNILDTIAWKAAMSDNEDIYQMILSLGELLRANTLAHEKDFVTLEEEMNYVKVYVYLQQMRFEDKISIDILADPKLYGFPIPRFCIQPLVENAIVHGLEPQKGPGKLCINIIDHPDCMEIVVIDNGVGFEGEICLSDFTPSSEDSHTHIGLNNLNKRLNLLYGPESQLNLLCVPGRYTAVSFQIPKS